MHRSEYTDNLSIEELEALEVANRERQFEDSNSDPHFKEDKPNSSLSSSELYERGKNLLFDSGFLLKLDPSSDRALHSVYYLTHPQNLKGLTYPDSFKYWKKLTSKEDRLRLERLIKAWDPELQKFWFPLLIKWSQKNSVSPLQSYAELLIREDLEDIEINHNGFDLGLNPICEGLPFSDSQEYPLSAYPRVYLPAKEWFDESLHVLKPSDILSIFPETELPLFQLILGRALVGRNNHIVPGTTEPIEHTSRMAALVQSEAGLGKSDTFSKGLFKALRKVGYSISISASTLDPKFANPSTYTSEILYVDDTSEKKLTQILSSEGSKRIITGDKILVEEKFKMPLPVYANCVPIICLNDIDEYASYKMDSGNEDRFFVFTLYTKEELKSKPLTVNGETSPSRSPKQHINWLAQKFNVSVETIWLYLCRLCADDFWQTITHPNPENLYLEVQKRKSYLAHSWGSNIVTRIAYFIYWGAKISDHNSKNLPSYDSILSINPFKFSANLLLMVDRNSIIRRTLLDRLKADYDANPNPFHPYLTLLQIIPQSVQKVMDRLRQNPHQETLEAWEIFFQSIDTETGFQFSPQALRITQTWQHVIRSSTFLESSIDSSINAIIEGRLDSIQSVKSQTIV